jgi:hypothetical protein
VAADDAAAHERLVGAVDRRVRAPGDLGQRVTRNERAAGSVLENVKVEDHRVRWERGRRLDDLRHRERTQLDDLDGRRRRAELAQRDLRLATVHRRRPRHDDHTAGAEMEVERQLQRRPHLRARDQPDDPRRKRVERPARDAGDDRRARKEARPVAHEEIARGIADGDDQVRLSVGVLPAQVFALRLAVARRGKSRGVERLAEDVERLLGTGGEGGPKALVEAEAARELEALAMEDDDPGSGAFLRRALAWGCGVRARGGRRHHGEREGARPDGARAISGDGG